MLFFTGSWSAARSVLMITSSCVVGPVLRASLLLTRNFVGPVFVLTVAGVQPSLVSATLTTIGSSGTPSLFLSSEPPPQAIAPKIAAAGNVRRKRWRRFMRRSRVNFDKYEH